MNDDVLVRVENVSKRFCRSLKRSLWYGLQDLGSEIGGRRHGGASGLPRSSADVQLRRDEFWAVKDVNFELRRGECLGLIGRNGAGKTTLLRMLNGLIKPDTGQIEINGRIGALISLGAGFNPLLTGRENIYINASILGLSSREVESKIEDMINFSGIGEFIDSPVQSYSSGMQVRLGFSVAIALEPDILLIDEVLAVGDTEFKVKCYNRIRSLLDKTAIIFVSHSMFDVARSCSRVLALHHGSTHYEGQTSGGIQAYNFLNHKSIKNSNNSLIVHLSQDIASATVSHLKSGSTNLDSWISFDLNITASRSIHNTIIRVVFHDDSDGEAAIAEWNSGAYDQYFNLIKGANIISLKLTKIRLRSGIYRAVIVIGDSKGQGYYALIEDGVTFNVSNQVLAGAHYRV